ncbi:MAG: type I-E CRISPR-associated protein Cas7/Cse4/CasC [Anaerolineae bacterium]
MFIELHMLQSFAPANLNRDDTNNPKDCEFGGVRRARISSQCLKRAIRREPVFARTTGVTLADRTRLLARDLHGRLLEAGKPEPEIDTIVPAFVEAYVSKEANKGGQPNEKKAPLDKETGRTTVLLYLSEGERTEMALALSAQWQDLLDDSKRKAIVRQLSRTIIRANARKTSAPDIAMFGRMLADKPEASLEAACQVAHAISTHRVTMEMDYFTAVDDLLPSDDTGAGHVDFTGYDSACFYRYARVDWGKLLDNLDGDVALARRTLEAFLRAAVLAVPTGKQNSFAAQNPPSLLFAIVREDGGWSLANAFERPVRAQADGGFVAPSAAALDAFWGRLTTAYGSDGIRAAAALSIEELPLTNLAPALTPSSGEWLARVLGALPQEAGV